MRLATYVTSENPEPRLGVVVGEDLVEVAALLRHAGVTCPELASMRAFVTDPIRAQGVLEPLATEEAAREVGALPLAEVRCRPPLDPPAALLDFALTPQHLANSARTMVRHEYSWISRLLSGPAIAARVRKAEREENLPYYAGNHHAVIGDDEATSWPRYTSYLDIEPELAVVTGPADAPVAGYTILNDVSARDVQMPELSGFCFTRSKHFARSNGLGPFLVTPDEVGDPRALDVEVRVGDQLKWRGRTDAYRLDPPEVVAWLRSFTDPVAGMVLGLGTVPGCCGLDNDEWLLPGDEVAITFERLGTLRQRIPHPDGPLEPSRWGARDL